MSLFADEDLRQDAFLGGRLQLWQPKRGYRAGLDPVLLAASVPAKPGDRVLDLGCGAGAAGLCLAARVPELRLTGLERQKAYAELARRNAAQAGVEMLVVEGDVRAAPTELKALSFDHVIANPPYYDRARGTPAPDASRETALGEDAILGDWVKLAFKRVKPKGYMHLILKADRLADILSALGARFGSIEVLPVAPRVARPAELILLRARKDGRTPLKLHAPKILHEGAHHPGDQDHYTSEISGVLRRGISLEWPNY